MIAIKQLLKIILSAVKRFFANNSLYEASALAFTTLLTLVPLFSVAVYALTILPFFDSFFLEAKHYIFANFVPASGVTIEKYLEEFSQQATVLPATSMLFLFVSILMLINLVKNIINDIWGDPTYHSIYRRLVHFIAILVMPVLISIGIYVSNVLIGIYWITHTADMLGLQLLLSGLGAFLVEMLSFTLVYYVMPSCPVRFQDSLLGGLIATILFEIAKIGFVLYLRFFPSYQLIYGALALVPIFLLWLYISWSIVIFGGMIAHGSSQEKNIS